MAEKPLPEGKRYNSFTGEVIDKKPLSLAPSPMDQQILGMIGEKDKPLIELCAEVVDSIGNDSGPKNHDGPSLQEDSHPRLASLPIAPETNTLPGPGTGDEPVQHIDVPPANAQAVADGAPLSDRDTVTPEPAKEPTPRKTHKRGKKNAK